MTLQLVYSKPKPAPTRIRKAWLEDSSLKPASHAEFETNHADMNHRVVQHFRDKENREYIWIADIEFRKHWFDSATEMHYAFNRGEYHIVKEHL